MAMIEHEYDIIKHEMSRTLDQNVTIYPTSSLLPFLDVYNLYIVTSLSLSAPDSHLRK